MSGRLIAGGLIGLGCIAAAAGGGYMALRSNAADASRTQAAGPVEVTPVPTQAPAATVANAPAPPPAAPERPEPAAHATRTAGAAATKVSIPDTPRATPRTPAQAAVTTATATGSDAQASAQSMAPSAPATAPPLPASATPAPAPPAPAPAPAPPPRYEEVTVTADSVLGLQLDSTISSETARVEDRVNARLSRDVLINGKVAIASGARLEGTVTRVDRGGKFKDRPRLGIAFNTLVLADGTRVSIQTDTIFREGDSPAGQVSAKVGGSAMIGAIVGAMIGGKKGALVGTTAGLAGGAAAVAAGDRAEAVLTSGTPLTVRLTAPITVLIERDYE